MTIIDRATFDYEHVTQTLITTLKGDPTRRVSSEVKSAGSIFFALLPDQKGYLEMRHPNAHVGASTFLGLLEAVATTVDSTVLAKMLAAFLVADGNESLGAYVLGRLLGNSVVMAVELPPPPPQPEGGTNG